MNALHAVGRKLHLASGGDPGFLGPGMIGANHPSLLLGLAAALASVAIGVGWQVATRFGATTTLHPIDLVLLRYAVPAVVLAPIWLRVGLLPRGVRGWTMAAMVVGAGLPFGLAATAGARFAPVAHMGVLLPGAMPLLVAALSAWTLGERFSAARRAGFALILAGVLAIGLPALAETRSGAWRGDLLFLAAAALWAVYTVAYRRSGLSPWASAAVVSAWSGIAAVPLWLLSGAGRLAAAPVADVLVQFLMQGLVAGVVGLGVFAVAVRHLGASAAAASGALVPAASAAAGWLALGEPLDAATAAGTAAATVGVALAAGIRPARRCAAALPPSERMAIAGGSGSPCGTEIGIDRSPSANGMRSRARTHGPSSRQVRSRSSQPIR